MLSPNEERLLVESLAKIRESLEELPLIRKNLFDLAAAANSINMEIHLIGTELERKAKGDHRK